MPDDKEKKVVSTDHPLWKAILEQAQEIGYGSFMVLVNVHQNQPKDIEISEPKKRFRVN
jgi:hypothetical protein